jgi:hypothetical protein
MNMSHSSEQLQLFCDNLSLGKGALPIANSGSVWAGERLRGGEGVFSFIILFSMVIRYK